MTATEQYIEVLTRVKPGELGLLRTHAGKGLDETVHGFDLFASLWWPLRQGTERAPRREVAWLIAKLYAYCPITHSPDDYLARQLGRCLPNERQAKERYRKRFDRMLALPVGRIEPALQWALDWVSSMRPSLDWVKLTDDLSIWEREATRLRWALQFIDTNERT
ncbi:MAG: type I-E CRISPR-associated protein Cse2/CasB [Candidatus Micrarchaeota archaeon]